MESGQRPPEETLLNTALTFLKVFDSLDASVIRRIQAETYTHYFAPASLGIHERNLTQFADHLKGLKAVLKAFPVIPKETFVNPSLKQVTFWATAIPEFHQRLIRQDDGEKWSYQGEYIFMLFMDHTGGKVERVIEFLDSKGTEHLMELVKLAKSRAL